MGGAPSLKASCFALTVGEGAGILHFSRQVALIRNEFQIIDACSAGTCVLLESAE